MKKLIFIVIAVTLVFSLLLVHRSTSYTVIIQEESQIKELKLNTILDTDRKYKMGDKYMIKHTFLFGEVYKREIERVNNGRE